LPVLPEGAQGPEQDDRYLGTFADDFRLAHPSKSIPALFNADGVVTQLLRKGKTVEDAREGGTSGCVETGAFGKEAYVLTGYFNLPKILELALHDGMDPRTGRRLGPPTGDPRGFATYDDLFAAWTAQMRHFVDIRSGATR
jgi:formate C-acetyltransferase